MGQGLHLNLDEEKRLTPSKQMTILWEGGRRDGAYFDPLSIDFGTMD